MVKRIISISFVLILILCFCLPAFAADDIQTDTDTFGFAYNDSKIYFFNKDLPGYSISVDTQIIPATRMYLFIPCTGTPASMEVYYTFMITTGAVKMNACDYGTIYSNSYHITASLPVPALIWVGTSTIEGSSARYFSCKSTFSNLPFTSSQSGRYIRLTIDVDTDFATALNLCTYLQKNLNQSMSGTVYADSDHKLDLNGTQKITPTSGSLSSNLSLGQANVTLNSGNLKLQEGYISGAYRSYYASGSYSTVTLNSSATYPYFRIPALAVQCNSTNSLGGKIAASTGTGTGSLTYASQWQGTETMQVYNGELGATYSGIYTDREYVNVLSMNASRQFNDSELIQAVNDASDRNHTDITNFSNRNHTDLVNIGNDLQELVDHQDQVNQAGINIGSTTSSSTISNTTGNLGSGVNGLNSTLSTASDVSSFVSNSTPYISFIGAFLPVILNFGDGVLAWAVVAIIAVTVFLYILKKVSE